MNEAILDFFINDKPNPSGHTINQIVNWSDEKWEGCHDFIQWIFPLDEPSSFNEAAPILDEETLRILRGTTAATVNISKIMQRARQFFGWSSKEKPHWFKPGDHNMLRISRMLKFLNLMRFHMMATTIYNWLDELDYLYPGNASEVNWDYWQQAYYGSTLDKIGKLDKNDA